MKSDEQRTETYEVEIVRDLSTRVAITETWRKGITLHREDGPALVRRDATTGTVIEEGWWIPGTFHIEADCLRVRVNVIEIFKNAEEFGYGDRFTGTAISIEHSGDAAGITRPDRGIDQSPFKVGHSHIHSAVEGKFLDAESIGLFSAEDHDLMFFVIEDER